MKIPSLKSLAIQELQKYQVKSFYYFDKNKKYFLITQEGLHIDLGCFLNYKNKSIVERICWHDGPTFSKVQWHFEFSNLDEDLKKELNLIECVDFYKKYVGFYEYPN
jgi:hypothetical protein